MTKRVNVIFSIIILFCSVLILPLKVLATNVSITGNGAADATVTTSSGENVTNNNDLNRYENYKVSYHWTLASGVKVNDGDTASFTLPDNVQVLNNTTFDVTLDDGTVIGQFNIKAGEKVGTLTFNNYLSQHPMTNVSGHLSFWGNGTQNQSTETPEINKVGWVNDQGKPTWSVLYNPKGEERDNVTIEDTLEGKQTLDKESIKIEYGTMQNGVFVADSQQPEGTTLDTNEKGFKLSIPKLDKTVRITYTSTPENTQFDLDNKVVATSDQLTMVQNDASITVGGSGDVTGTTESTTTSSSSESTESTTTPSSSESTESTTTPSSSESTESTTTSSSNESTESTTTPSSSESTESTTTPSSSESTESTTTPSSSESTESTTTSSSSESTESTTTSSSSESTESTTTSSSNESTESTTTSSSSESTESTTTPSGSDSTESTTTSSSSESTESTTTPSGSDSTESTTTSSSSESTESTTTSSSNESTESTTTSSSNESTESTTTPSGSESTESTTTTGGSQRKQQPSVVVMTDNNHSSNQRPGAGAPANATTLPQTGNKENHILMIVGLVMLVIFSILSITLYYRHRMMK